MDKALKQRILGAIVLVALGVIFIPALLDGSGFRSRETRSIEIPLPPKFPPLSQTTLEPVPTPVDEKIEQLVNEQKKPTAPVVQALALQVGIFGSKENAESFAKTMRKEGASYVEASTMDGKQVYRVCIGPELDRARLEKLKDKLKAERKIQAFIISYP